MIFDKQTARRITEGRQTLLLARITHDGLTGRPKPSWCQRFKIGEDIAVQAAAGAEASCRVMVTSRDRVVLGDLDFFAARDLGFRTQADMARDLLERHDQDWPPLEEAICSRCEGWAKVENGGPCDECEFGVVMEPRQVPDEVALERFRSRLGDREMWAVRFEIAPEAVRFLSAGVIAEEGSRSPQGDYVTTPSRALTGEPPAVDEVTQARLSREAHQDQREREETRLERQVTDAIIQIGGNPADRQTRTQMRSAIVTARRRNQGWAA